MNLREVSHVTDSVMTEKKCAFSGQSGITYAFSGLGSSRSPHAMTKQVKRTIQRKQIGGVTTTLSHQHLGKVLEMMRLLWALDHSLQARSKRMLSTLGVTGPQRLVVRIVGRFPGISAGELAKILCIHPSTLTGILSRLERKLIITRTWNKTDARMALFRLTTKGHMVHRLRSGTVEAAVQQALTTISPRKILAAQETLQQLQRALE
jgi:MarR family transcriptional regulator, organic hydroperoxide resistance regulator